MSKEGTSQKEAATTSWPVEYPTALKNVRMTCSEDGKYITCTACSVYDSRKASKSGVVSCARGRIFRFDSMLDHIKHEYHTTSMSRLAIDEDGAKLSTDQFRKKYGRDFAKRKKATTMSDFFHFLPKKAKNAHTENVTIDDAIIESDEFDI